jgi:hypothetical protein
LFTASFVLFFFGMTGCYSDRPDDIFSVLLSRRASTDAHLVNHAPRA